MQIQPFLFLHLSVILSTLFKIVPGTPLTLKASEVSLLPIRELTSNRERHRNLAYPFALSSGPEECRSVLSSVPIQDW